MLFLRKRLNILVILLTVVLVTVLPYIQYRSYLYNSRVTKEQLALNTLRGQILFLDEALTLSSRSFVLTKDQQWHDYYKAMQQKFRISLSQIDSLLPGSYEGKNELTSSHDKLMAMEERSFKLTDSNKSKEAQTLLFSKPYNEQEELFSAGIKKLTVHLDNASDNLFLSLQSEAVKNVLVRGLIVLMLLIGWILVTYRSKYWQRKINAINQQKTEDAIKAALELERVNTQLRQLSKHLNDVREKERLSLSYEINEMLGQQVAAMKIKITDIYRKMKGLDKPIQEDLKEIVLQLNEALNFIRKLATDVYPLVLRDLGLIEALHWKTEEAHKQSGIAILFTSELTEIQLDKRTQNTLFHSFEIKLESLISKGATEIISNLRIENDKLILNIYDDTKNDQEYKVNGMEDIEIKERLSLIQGKSETYRSGKDGNNFIITIPYNLN